MSSQDPFRSPLKDHSSAANEEHQVLHNFMEGEVGKKNLFSSFFLQSLKGRKKGHSLFKSFLRKALSCSTEELQDLLDQSFCYALRKAMLGQKQHTREKGETTSEDT